MGLHRAREIALCLYAKPVTTRRTWLTTVALLPFVRAARALDIVKVTVRYEGKVRVWWEPRDVAEKRFAAVMALLNHPPKNSRVNGG